MARGTLVDSNVLLDILTEDPRWLDWSSHALADAAEAGPLYIDPIVYSEVSVRFSSVEALDDALPPQDYRREPLPWAAAFLAGKVFLEYRRNGGTKSTTLPDGPPRRARHVTHRPLRRAAPTPTRSAGR